MSPTSRAPLRWRARGGTALLALALGCAAAFVFVHFRWTNQAIGAYNRLDRSHVLRSLGQPIPFPPSRTIFQNPDSFLWVDHALRVASGETLRVRSTSFDNHPRGREVHWFNGLTWMLAGAGRLRRLLTGEDLRTALEQASFAVNPLLFGLLLIAVALALSRAAGFDAALVATLALVGSRSFLTGFSPGGPDHHGFAAAAALGSLLGILVGGGGWTGADDAAAGAFPGWRRARAGFVVSALSGAVGLWVSAFSQIMVLALVGAGFLALLAIGGDPRAGGEVRYRPELWRLWGRAGAAASCAMYLLEYFPAHLGLRLEVNHPLYALAWWGAAELMAMAAEARFAGAGAGAGSGRRRAVRGALALSAAAAAPLTVFVGGAAVLAPLEPFVWRLHQTIFEFKPMRGRDFVATFGALALAGMLAALRSLLSRPRREEAGLVGFALACAGLAAAAVFWQYRWWSAAAPALVALAVCGLLPRPRRSGVLWRRPVLAAALGAILFAQAGALARTTLAADHRLKTLQSPDIVLSSFLIVRDVADVLRWNYGVGRTAVLSGEWSSVVLAYEGDFGVVPSLYWENADGLKAAADIFLAESDEEAQRLLAERGISHLVIARSDFNPGEMYFHRHGVVDQEALARTLGARILDGQAPAWLQPLPYQTLIGQLKDPALFGIAVFRVEPRPRR